MGKFGKGNKGGPGRPKKQPGAPVTLELDPEGRVRNVYSSSTSLPKDVAELSRHIVGKTLAVIAEEVDRYDAKEKIMLLNALGKFVMPTAHIHKVDAPPMDALPARQVMEVNGKLIEF